MKFKTSKEILFGGLQIVQNVITPKQSLPILANILMEVKEGKLRLVGTDLDIGISCELPVNSSELGLITVPAKRFSEIIRELSEEEVTISSKKNNSVTIETQNCQFKILGLSAEEFPKLPEFKNKEAIKIEQALFKQLLGLTSFAVSFDESRYILNGILFKISKNSICLVATDGKRLAVAEKKLNQETDKEINVIVPIKTIHELNRNLKNEGDVSLVVSNNQILFDLGPVVIISRLIEGEFPDYKQVIPAASENKMVINRQDFLQAIRRASLLSTPDYQAVKWELFKNKAVVSKSTPDVGESREEVAVDYSGKELVIGFNPGYIIDVLKNLNDEKINVEIADSDKPAVIRASGYIYLVLPMRLN